MWLQRLTGGHQKGHSSISGTDLNLPLSNISWLVEMRSWFQQNWNITNFLGISILSTLRFWGEPPYVQMLLKNCTWDQKMVILRKVCLEQSNCIGSNLPIILYGNTIYVKGKEKFIVIPKRCYSKATLVMFVKSVPVKRFQKRKNIAETRKSSCVNARGIPPSTEQAHAMLFW